MRFTPPMPALIIGVVLLLLVQLGIVSPVLGKLGLTKGSALLILVISILGSTINVPLAQLRGDPRASTIPVELPDEAGAGYRGTTLLSVNVGGCLVPISFCIYLFDQEALGSWLVLAVIAVVAVVSYLLSRPVPGKGIALLSPFVPPVTAAGLALLLNPEQAAPSAYIGGTVGALIGADVMALGSVKRLRVPIAAIGGAGTFDVVFMTGILAVLLT